jgi:hypothetical protein
MDTGFITSSVIDVSIRTYAWKPHSRDAALLNEGLKTEKIDIGAIPFYSTI